MDEECLVSHEGTYLAGYIISRIFQGEEELATIISAVKNKDNLREWNLFMLEDGLQHKYEGYRVLNPEKELRSRYDENDEYIGIPQPHADMLESYLWQLNNA